ncbi:MAG: hypothetical protein ACRC6I_09235 [Paracoccaceae bacterium]
MKWVAGFLLLTSISISSAYVANSTVAAWDIVHPAMDIREAIRLLGSPDAHEGDDTAIWFSKGALVTFPLFIGVLTLRVDGCSNCGEKTYRVISKTVNFRLFMVLDAYSSEETMGDTP